MPKDAFHFPTVNLPHGVQKSDSGLLMHPLLTSVVETP